MPKYKVLAASEDIIPVCVLATRNVLGKIDYLKIKELTAENAEIFLNKDIIVLTTNREIVPSDIVGPLESDENPEEDLGATQRRYHILSAADDALSFCNLTVHDEEGRLSYLHVKNLDAAAAAAFIGEEILVSTLAHEIIPRDIVVKSLAIEPEVPKL